MTDRYPNSFKEFFRSLFRMPSSFSDFWQTTKDQRPYVFVIVGCIFFVFGGYMEVSQRLFISSSTPVTAKIVKIDKRRSKKNFVFRPVLEIEQSDGSKYQYKGNTWIYPNPHHEGEIVQARYSNGNGRIVSVDFISHQLFLAKISIFVGGGLLLLGIIIMNRTGRKSLT